MTNITQDEVSAYLAFWGEERLQRWRASTALATSLPPSSKNFLVEVGMPAQTSPGRGAAQLGALVWDLKLQRRSTKRSFATYISVPIMIDEARSSEIWRAGTQATRDGLPAAPERLYNSSVEQFALALTEDYKRVQAISPYLNPHDGVRTLEEEEAKFKVNIDKFEARLAEIDPHALSAHESFWADKIFTMRCEVDEDFANNATR